MRINKSYYTGKFFSALASMIMLLLNGYSQVLPAASFLISDSIGCSPLSIQFTNTSASAVSFFWDFGNGNTSTLQNPTNLYLTPGTYTVRLIAVSSNGQSDTITVSNLITVVPDLDADFYAVNTTSCLGGTPVSFTNTSLHSDYWIWDFGDGNTSTLQDPDHTYIDPGYFNVTLVAGNAFGCSEVKIKSQYIYVYLEIIEDFIVDTMGACDVSHSFSFNNITPGASSWLWDFGDGNHSTSQNPVHTYSSTGIYTVSLAATNTNGCSDTLVKNDFINIDALDISGLTADITSGCAPLIVHFNDPSSDAVSWLWDFGDGNVSSSQSPYYIYTTPGSFDVLLNVTNSNGCTDDTVLYNYIQIHDQPIAGFSISNSAGCAPLPVLFTDISASAASWLWDFGDGITSTQQNPSHTYTSSGNFTVTLTAYTSEGCSDIIQIADTVNVLNSIVDFGSDISNGCAPLTVTFSDSTVGANQWFWNFDDGAVSTQQNPVHTFDTIGEYDVTLITENTFGCIDTAIFPSYIKTVFDTPSYVPPPPITGCAPLEMSFSDNTNGAVSWHWNFGDGSSSQLQNPTYNYTASGSYNVSLAIELLNGCTQIIQDFNTFNIQGGSAGFEITPDQCSPDIVEFADTSSNAVSWFWDFGDGNTSTQQTPIHLYNSSGAYPVSLTITTSYGCSYTVIQIVTVVTSFFAAAPSYAMPDTSSPTNIDFFANTPGANSWFWDFGDGNTSTLENPSHYYATGGIYDIILVISDGTCTDTLYYILEIVPLDFPFDMQILDSASVDTDSIPAFSLSGCAPLTVYFNNILPVSTSWYWNFGDGNTSILENPSHMYYIPGIYDVTLIAQVSSGLYDTIILQDYIYVSGTVADFTILQTIDCDSIIASFTDNSGYATQWSWDFGDGTISNQQNPVHNYPISNNIYPVILTTYDTIGCSDMKINSIYSGITEPSFSFEEEICFGDTVYFTSTLQNISAWQWDFGDGNYSTDASPQHFYDSLGVYQVNLVVTDSAGCSQNYPLPDINVRNPLAGFIVSVPTSGCDTLPVSFDNISTDAVDFLWDFGDGDTSTHENPTHTYYGQGAYPVTLTASNSFCHNTMTIDSLIDIYSADVDFTYIQDSYCFPVSVNYIDNSSAAVSWHWDFGDGNNSNVQNPNNVFNALPSSDVTLTITDTNGCQGTVSKPNIEILNATFSASQTSGCVPFTVSFTNQSNNAVLWFWDFGDGNTSSQPNPVHQYTDTGSFDVELVVQSLDGCIDSFLVDSMIYTSKPVADFASPDAADCAPSLVTFTDLSQNSVSWYWNFGDGTNASNSDPAHIYTIPGLYTIQLIIGDQFGCLDTMIRVNYIEVLGPVASFTSSDTEGCQGLDVQFTNMSTGAVSWDWNLGDGSTSTQQNPQHIYENAGQYMVSLIVGDSIGCYSVYTLPDPIIIHKTANAGFYTIDTTGCNPLSSSFVNISEFSDMYFWVFGDGDTSNLESPTHVYSNPGMHSPYLIADNSFGCRDTFYFGSIVVLQTPTADFTTDTTKGCSPLEVIFSDQSADLNGAMYFWNFGNDLTSNFQNPVVSYTNPGFFDVSLTVVNSNGCADNIIKQDYIEVYDLNPPQAPNILTVTVVSDTGINIIWEQGNADDFSKYVLYRKNPKTDQFEEITVIDDQNITNYTDNDINTLQNYYCYMVQAVDICDNVIGTEELTEHCSIYVTANALDDKIEIEWTSYVGCSVNSYEIYRKEVGETNLQLIAAVSSNVLNYLDSTVFCPVEFLYFIKATMLCGNSISSTSNTSVAGPIDNIFIDRKVEVVRTTVIDNNTVLTEWKAPDIVPELIAQYNIYRSADSFDYKLLTSVPASVHEYVDYNVDVNNKNYYYKIEFINTCFVPTVKSNIGSSILLKAELIDNVSILEWTPYTEWENGVDYYIIEKLNNRGEWEIIKVVDGNTTHFEDD